jgi:hypothetical protein
MKLLSDQMRHDLASRIVGQTWLAQNRDNRFDLQEHSNEDYSNYLKGQLESHSIEQNLLLALHDDLFVRKFLGYLDQLVIDSAHAEPVVQLTLANATHAAFSALYYFVDAIRNFEPLSVESAYDHIRKNSKHGDLIVQTLEDKFKESAKAAVTKFRIQTDS